MSWFQKHTGKSLGSGRKEKNQSHVELACDISAHFACWCSASEVGTYEDLCNLIVREQFKCSVPDHLAPYINELKVITTSAAAVLTDEYILTHSRRLTAYRDYGGTQREKF